MSRPPCRSFAEDRSALVDGSLPAEPRERLLVHLVHCAPCRADVAELRRLREALRSRSAQDAPQELAQRLVQIAGAEAAAPLWCRPFRRTRTGTLTRRRRLLRLRITAAALAVGSTVVGAGLLGYAEAPGSGGAGVGDPGVRAQAEFGSTLAQLPLGEDALGVVVGANPSHLKASVPVGGRGPAVAGSRPITATEAEAALRRAVAAAGTVGYRGDQLVWARRGEHVSTAKVAVRAVPGQGSTAQLLDRSSRPVGAVYGPESTPTRVADESAVDLLAAFYHLHGWSDAEAAGRHATVVQATRADGSPAARWWLDDESGIVLARQTFDANRKLLSDVEFARVRVAAPSTALEPLPAGRSAPVVSAALTLSYAPVLNSRGWTCEDHLAGLALVRLRSDGADEPGAVHLVYTDGVSTLSVSEQRGQLTTAPDGSSWDTTLGAWTRTGTVGLASWQSGERVFTVVTDGPSSLLAAAVSSLPHDPAPERTTMERIREGWGTLLADMKG
jgi:anti-sigma factor RsiW